MSNKSQSCYDCQYYDFRSDCMWFNPKRKIPKNVIDKGCKFYKLDNKPKILKYIIDKFEGEIL